MVKTVKESAEYILPLYMNGLAGRMLRMPPQRNKRREIMLIYGHHASLERMSGMAEYLNKFGAVTIPDLPGFGGMEPFYKIGEEANLDNMADYLAAFIKLRFRNKRLTLIGTSLGFMIITRMLQKSPELAKKIDILISIVGFTNKKDFKFGRLGFYVCRFGTAILSGRISSTLVRYLALQGTVIRFVYWLVESRNPKLKGQNKDERRRRINFEIHLWQCNDVRTYMKMGNAMFNLDLRGKHVTLPVHHVSIQNDQYFDGVRVEQHMREIYSDFFHYKTKLPAHTPAVVATAKEVEPYVPPKLRRLLRK